MTQIFFQDINLTIPCYAQAQIWERYKAQYFGKFNCSLLRDKEHLDQVNTEIQNVTEEYAADHYDRSTLHNIPKSVIKLSIPDKLVLDFILMKIRSKTIAYASMKKTKTQEKEHKRDSSVVRAPDS